MSDPVYQPPKTDPRLAGKCIVEPPTSKLSPAKLVWYIFLPTILLIISTFGFVMIDELFFGAVYITPIVALILNVAITKHFATEGNVKSFIFYYILHTFVQAILLSLTFFIGCVVALSGL